MTIWPPTEPASRLDANGKEKATYEAGESITYLQSAKEGVVIGSDRRYTGLSHGGNENWDYTATGDLTDLIPMEKLNIVMTVGKEQVSIFDMSKAQSMGTGTSRADEHRTKRENTDAGAEQKSEEGKSADTDETNENKPVETSNQDTEDGTAENEE